MKITQFDRPTIRVITPQLEAALQEVAKQLGIEIKVGGASWTSQEATVKVQLLSKNADGSTYDPYREDFKKYADMFQLDVKWLDSNFWFAGKIYTVKGLNLRSRKAPVLAANPKGKLYKFDVQTVRAAINVPKSVVAPRLSVQS